MLSIALAILASMYILNYVMDDINNGEENNIDSYTKDHRLQNIKKEKGEEIGTSTYGDYLRYGNKTVHNNVWGLTNKERNNNNTNVYTYYNTNGNFGWEWNRSDPRSSPDVYVPPIYPEVIIGEIPSIGNGSSTLSYFPIRSRDIEFFTSEIEYEYVRPTNGAYNLAYDIYWVDPDHHEKKKLNIMIWIHGRLSNDKIIKYVSDGISEYEYHYKAPSGEQYWPWYAFILKNQEDPKNYHKVDIKKLLDQLPKGAINGSWVIPGMELGNEVWRGSGKIEIYKYEINLNNNTIQI